MPIGYRGRNPKRDATEPAIVEAWQAIGGRSYPLSDPNIPDRLVAIRGEWILCEVKSRGGKLSPGQRDFIEDTQDRGGDIVVAYGADDVYAYARNRGWID